MAQLVDLSGLGALTEVNELAVANNANLTALTGASLLWGMNAFDAIENPKLKQAAIDGFVESLTKKSRRSASASGGDCSCSEFHVVAPSAFLALTNGQARRTCPKIHVQSCSAWCQWCQWVANAAAVGPD